MESIEEPAVVKAAQPRTSQACQRCRSLKIRCLPSVQSGTCQRYAHTLTTLFTLCQNSCF
ncbi:hypothetical protein BKA66DRAFT_467073 [Pyrenochaeta sp. MPI-SDFR-AT-0127]|nr:hypothetical protein BKA66DRAFT_467073 [Pyrenochaeta sp. MPI-SDFR-AT-0127]